MKALGKGSVASIVRVGLTIAWWLLIALAAALAIAAIGYAVALVLINAGMLEPEKLTLNREGPGAPVVGAATWPIIVPGLLVGAVVVGGYLVIVGRLRQLFDSFTSGEPFRRANAQHLRVIWIALLAVELTRYLLMALTGALLALVNTEALQRFEWQFDLSTWAAILILIVLAEVFREGARLKEEQELTI